MALLAAAMFSSLSTEVAIWQRASLTCITGGIVAALRQCNFQIRRITGQPKRSLSLPSSSLV